MRNVLFFLLFIVSSFSGEKTRILYIRHGEVPGNDPRPEMYIYTGCGTDDSLTEKGRGQAEKCAKTILNLQNRNSIGLVTAIYASELKRAVETAKPIAQKLGLEIQSRCGLREIDWGYADGKLVRKMEEEWGDVEREVKRQYPDRKMRWDHLPVFPNSETYNALLERSLEELKSIGEKHKGETVLVVGHGRVLKTLIAEWRNSEEKIPYPSNCGIAEFTYSNNEGLCFVKVFDEPTIEVIERSEPEVIEAVLGIQKTLLAPLSEVPPFAEAGFLTIEMTHEYLEKFLQTGKILIARQEGRIVGYLLLDRIDGFIDWAKDKRFDSEWNLERLRGIQYIDQIAVLRSYARQGIGTALVEEAKKLSPRGILIDILFAPYSNHASMQFFASQGFVPLGIVYVEAYSKRAAHATSVMLWDAI